MMIARQKPSQTRREEVLRRLEQVPARERSSRLRAAANSPDRTSGIVELCDALTDLGPVFSAYGDYLSARGDLLRGIDRVALRKLRRSPRPMAPSEVREALNREVSRARTRTRPVDQPGESADCQQTLWGKATHVELASVHEDAFDTRPLFQRHLGRLSNGTQVVVRLTRVDANREIDLGLLPFLKELIAPRLSDATLFEQSVDDFRASAVAQCECRLLAESLSILRHDARGDLGATIPQFYNSLSTSSLLVLDCLPGRRLSESVVSAENLDGHSDRSVYADGPFARDDHARRLCEFWLRQAFDSGLVAVEFDPFDVVLMGRMRFGLDEGVFVLLPHETRTNMLAYLVASALDEPLKALDALLKEFESGRHSTPPDELDRMFRQMVPDADRDVPENSPHGRLSTVVSAQWHLAIQNGYRPLRNGLPLIRGIERLGETASVLAPRRDAVAEGLKDYRLGRLLGDVHTMMEPMFWAGRLDKVITTLMASPRLFDDALSAAVPDRARREQRGRSSHESSRGGMWLVPALVMLAFLGLSQGRFQELLSRGGFQGEAVSAVLFVSLAAWVLFQVRGSET